MFDVVVFDVVALVCALGQAHAECQPPTAFDKIVLETGVPNEIRCLMDAEEHLAKAASLAPAGYYIKITCPRREAEKL